MPAAVAADEVGKREDPQEMLVHFPGRAGGESAEAGAVRRRSFIRTVCRFGRPGDGNGILGYFMVKFRAVAWRDTPGMANLKTDAAYLTLSTPDHDGAPGERP